MSNNTSVESKKDPYLRIKFWMRPENQFWECNLYSERTKQYFRDWLIRETENTRKLTSLL